MIITRLPIIITIIWYDIAFLANRKDIIMDYKMLWEALKKINGHREIKDLFPKGHIAHGRDNKTIKECMDSIERLYKINRLQDVIDGLDYY